MAQSHSHAAEAYRILFVIEPSTLAESTAESVTRRLHQTGVANLAYGTATSLAQLESLLPLHAWDLILCHFGHLPSDIADLLQVARRLRPQTPVFVVGAQVTNREAFELGRLGAQEFIDASDTEQLLACIRQALTARPIGVYPNDGVRLAAHEPPVDPLEQILDSMQDAIMAISLHDRRLIYRSASFEHVFGYPVDRFVDDPSFFKQVVPPEEVEMVAAARKNALRDGFVELEHRIMFPDGQMHWLQRRAFVVYDAERQPVQVIDTARDITASKTAEAKVRRSAENLLQQKSFLEILLALSSRLITTPADRLDTVLQMTLAEVGTFLQADRTYIFAYDFVRMTVTTTHEWCAPGIEPQIQSVQALPLAGLEQWAARHKSGRTVQIHNVEALAAEDGLRKILEMQSVQSLLAIPLMEDGECTGFVGLDAVRAPRSYDESDQQLLQILAQLIVNVRGRKNTLKALAASEAYLRSLVNSQTTFNVRVDMHGKVSYCNERYRRQFASDGASIIGTSSLDNVHPEDRHKVYAAVVECFADAGKIVQLEIRKGTEQSGYIWTLWEFSAVTAGDESIQEIQCVGFDISRQKQAEADLQEANLLLEQRIRERTAELQGERNLLRTVIEAMFEGLVVQDKDGAIQLRNSAAERILGLTGDQMIGRTSVDPRWQAVREDGTPFPGELHPAMVTLRTGAPQDSVVMGVHKVDDSLTWILINSQPLADASDPQRYAVVATFTDITALKEAEAASKAALAREKELGELKSRFLSMASHEFRNPLAGILTTTETLALLWERLDKAKIEARLDRIRDQVLRLTAITDDVLHLTRMQTGRSKLAAAAGDLDELVASVVGDLAELPGNQGRIQYDCAQRPVPAVFDARLLQQAIGNLLHNALKYSPADKSVRVTLAHADRRIPGEITLNIADEGIGIPPEDLPHLFEPFHRAANVGEIQGTGLGLAIAKEAIELHGGTIAVESRVGVGTTFVINLPGSTGRLGAPEAGSDRRGQVRRPGLADAE